MKLDQKPFEISSNNMSGLEAKKMSIDVASLQHIMDILTRLYPNPIKAVIREYSTNALDSHIEAGCDLPIEVKLPTSVNPTLSIKDYGVGMSKEQLLNQYSMYGFSTKRETNEQTGALGLGSKSALCVTPQFTVRSVKDGLITVALISRDDDSSASFKIMHHEQTTEGNGVTISIPVPSDDIQKYIKEAVEFFSLVDPSKYKLLNCVHDPSTFLVKRTLDFDNEEMNKAFEKLSSVISIYNYAKSGIFGLSNNSDTKNYRYNQQWFQFGSSIDHQNYTALRDVRYGVLMGNIFYPIKKELVNKSTISRFLDSSGNLLVFHAEIGEVSIAPQREDLLYDKKTEEWLNSKIDFVEKAYLGTIQDLIDLSSSGFEAVKVLNSFFSRRYDYLELLKLGRYFTYKDKLIPACLGAYKGESIVYNKSEANHIVTYEECNTYNLTNKYQNIKTNPFKTHYRSDVGRIDFHRYEDCVVISEFDISSELTPSVRNKLSYFWSLKTGNADPKSKDLYMILHEGSASFESMWVKHSYSWPEVEEAWKNRPKPKGSQKSSQSVLDEEYTIHMYQPKGKPNSGHYFVKQNLGEILKLHDQGKLLVALSIPANKKNLERVSIRLTFNSFAGYFNKHNYSGKDIVFIDASRNVWGKIVKASNGKIITFDQFAEKYFEIIRSNLITSEARIHGKIRNYELIKALGIQDDEIIKPNIKEHFERCKLVKTKIENVNRNQYYENLNVERFLKDIVHHGIAKIELADQVKKEGEEARQTLKSELNQVQDFDSLIFKNHPSIDYLSSVIHDNSYYMKLEEKLRRISESYNGNLDKLRKEVLEALNS